MRLYLAFIAIVMLASCNKGGSNPESVGKPENFDQKISYTIGLQLGQSFKNDSINIQNDFFLRGLIDGMKGDTSQANLLMSEKERSDAQKELNDRITMAQQNREMQQQAEFRARGDKAKEEGKKYLEANKNKPGVKVLTSGVQYKVIKEGKGAVATDVDMVKVHIIAKFTDGKEFDNTYNREPVEIPVKGVIPGWEEVLKLMPVGSKWEVVIPAELAYGERGAGMTIPPNSTLIFEIELLGIEKGKGAEMLKQQQEMMKQQQMQQQAR